jgi:hypothetical protein
MKLKLLFQNVRTMSMEELTLARTSVVRFQGSMAIASIVFAIVYTFAPGPVWLSFSWLIFVCISSLILGMRMQRMSRRVYDIVSSEITHNLGGVRTLDTSNLMSVPMTDQEAEQNTALRGMFGANMEMIQAFDRDGRVYLGHLTSDNTHALWLAGFTLNSRCAPELVDVNHTIIHGESLETYPKVLDRFPRATDIWVDWTRLQRRYYDWHARGGEPSGALLKYYGEEGRRSTPLF